MKGIMRMNKSDHRISLVILIIIILGSSIIPNICYGQDDDEESHSDNPAGLQVAAQLLYERIANATLVFEADIKKHLGFCIKNVKDEWNHAFNFSRDLGFMTNCMQKNKDVPNRICNAAEVKIYFNSFLDTSRESSNYLEPNQNCNLSSWMDGCEPGWACSVGQNQKVDMNNVNDVPLRTKDCKRCCEGFFCPKGITCMLPCPLGAYCPGSDLNETSGACDPYTYQIPPGVKNHSCGGADLWSDVINGSEIFCKPGSYCPSTTQIISCSKGHYCRMGSVSQTPCFQLATCNPKTTNQNIHAYGVILIAILSTSLLLVYTFSDQVLTTREQRVAETRDRAIKSARETAQARERWKSAKDNAKQRAIGLQQQLSRTFSKRKPTQKQDNTSTTPSTSSSSKTTKKGPSSLTKMMHEIEDDPDSQEGFNVEVGDKNGKKQFNAKELHTRSQIFKYAYGQIEKEKAIQEQNKNLTFSGVISMATNDDEMEVRKRPLLEIDFKDLTLTLKGKHKHLLRCITGKLKPGRVSAVMGPSGAGKTTFLSAVTGKATGCNVTGSILINGKEESIHSYKRIFGFVPQDDIVHGDLTVEENLRFSARCRLPGDLPKPDKVLIIERVIEALGLQAIRDSLVGTIEKRGISGGQRKRVNVGLEMVIEPSLLVLDEPTSGLDSSSSLLLLRALRREALEGVNISMVIHQPSYALFKMFDDFILLAKGGLTVYHGPVKKVEEYFSGLGINVPERVTPPDHYIDILEGITKPGSKITKEQLPVRWMLHNGYTVPPDMLHLCDEPSGSSADDDSSTKPDTVHKPPENSFANEVLQEFKFNVVLRAEHLMHNFLSKKDLSNRVTPGSLRQYRYFLGRVTKQRLRESKLQGADYLILLLAGACLGTLAQVSDETLGQPGYNYTVIAVSLLCMISALRSFTLDRLQYWRESASGMSSLAYFLSKDTVDLFNVIVKPLVYLSMFYFFNNPRSSFGSNYLVLFCLVYCVTGIAYGLAIFLEPGPAQLWCVLLPVVLSLVASQDKDSKVMYELGKLTYSKWALQAFVVANAEKYDGVWLITRCGALMKNHYSVNDWSRCLVFLVLAGFLSRIVAFIFMLTFQKK